MYQVVGSSTTGHRTGAKNGEALPLVEKENAYVDFLRRFERRQMLKIKRRFIGDN